MASSSKELPEDILNMITVRFNETSVTPLRPGKTTWWPRLGKEVFEFLKSNRTRREFVNLWAEYGERGISNELIRRAFNHKKPYGASKPLRNLFALYVTDGTLNWNNLIRRYFSKHISLIDEEPLSKGQTYAFPTEEQLSVIGQRLRIGASIPFSAYQVEKDDPGRPEFPPAPHYKPNFPASVTRRITVPGFRDVWVKDESTNPTGTHKDRMALEVLLKARGNRALQGMSIISSGSAAIAIQHLFNLDAIPYPLKVVCDTATDEQTVKAMRLLGCEVMVVDLSKKELTPDQIKALANNQGGMDITYRKTLDVYNVTFYDWMSYEILNEVPDYVLVPYGTGDLFINILNVLRREVENRDYAHDPRFKGNLTTLMKCHFIGATTHNPSSIMDKLYAAFLPSKAKHQSMVKELIEGGFIGVESGIVPVDDIFTREAKNIADQANIACEYSGIAGLGLLLQMQDRIDPNAKILVVNTGKTQLEPKLPKRRSR